MTRPSIGDHVSDLSGARDGTLIDIDGGTAYVMQANGVEIEFPIDRLKAYEPKAPGTVRTLSGPLRDRTLTPAEQALLQSVPAALRDAVARSYDGADGAPARPRFAQLPPDKQLETIRIYLPSLPPRLLAPHMKLVVAFRDRGRPRRPSG